MAMSISGLLFWSYDIRSTFDDMDLAYIGTGTSSKQAEPISPDEKAMLWSSQQFGTLTTHETSQNNNIQLSNTFQLCLCTYSICLYYDCLIKSVH